MLEIFNKEKYLKLKNSIIEDENESNLFIEKTKKYNKKFRPKIIRKFCSNKLNILAFIIIFFVIFFSYHILFDISLKIHNKLIKNVFTIMKKISESNNIINQMNNIKKPEKENKTENKNEPVIKIEPVYENETNPIPTNESIYKEEKFDSIHDSFNKAKDFLSKSMNGIYMQNKTKFKESKNPKVSAIIPLYNCKNLVLKAIKSIQNQNMLNLEIILVNDFSTDNTLSIVEKVQKEDPRIKIIKNKKNMGILYSRSIGALNAKGKYIFSLDNDDMFLDSDVFLTVSNISEKGNFDIVEFKGIFSLMGSSNLLKNRYHDTYFSGHKLNLVMFQPELGNYPIRPGKILGKYDIFDVFMWTRCIKTKIYQKALNKLGEERYSWHMLVHEDVVATCIIFNIAESYKFIGKYGTFHIQRRGSASFKRFPNYQTTRYNLYLTDVAIDFAKDTVDNKKIIVYLITYLLEQKELEKTLKIDEFHYNLFISCLKRTFESKFISDEHKQEIKNRIKKLKYINYNF